MNYLDTGILVRALLAEHPQHASCDALINSDAVSSCHSLAETFNTLTAFFKIPNETAAGLIESLPNEMSFETISLDDYLAVVRESRERGVQGGIVYDAIHAAVARRLKVNKIVTYNIGNFRHVAPDLNIVSP